MSYTKPLVLVDGSSYLYRAFHAMPGLTNSKGQPTGAIYGVVNMVRRLLKDYNPEHVAIVFDAKGKTFRDDMFPEYKAHRPPMPEELVAQIRPLNEVLEAMGFPLITVSGVEADDVIGTLAVQAAKLGMDTIISTGDKDLAQLVNEHVTLVNTMNDSTLDVPGVTEKFGIPPELIVDYLALIGDTVDNIPGVPKVGPKTAVKWLTTYGSLDEIIKHADDITGKVGENLRAFLDQLPLSRQLATIKLDVELEDKPTDLVFKGADNATLIELVKDLEFKTWLRELLGAQGQDQSQSEIEVAVDVKSAAVITDASYDTVLTELEFEKWLKRLEASDIFSFDTETTSLDYMEAEIVGVSFAVEAGKAAYVPVAHVGPGLPQQLSREWVLGKLKPLLERADKAKVGQNMKYDMSVLARYDIELKGVTHDTMLESYVLDSVATRHDMDSLSLKYLGHKTIKFEDVAGKGVKQLTFDQVPLEQAAPYAAEDADITLRLHQALSPQLENIGSLHEVFRDIEMPLVPVLSRIERNGVLVDAKLLSVQSGELASRMLELEQEAYTIAGRPFNLGSPKQIQQIFFEEQGLPVLKKTPKGVPSTAEEVLQELALDYPLPRVILEHRGISKLKSTYTDKLPLQINAHSGRVHTSYHQAVAATGRLSSSDPNLQNIPVRNAEGRRIRQAFIAPPGRKILAADYSQIELRIMAHLSGDERLLQSFTTGEDVHRATAAEVMGVALEDVTTEQRRRAKAINFGLIYGMSAFGLARQLDIERGEAQEYMNLYFNRYPGVKKYMDSIRVSAHDQGYVETLYGRRLYLPDINSSNGQRRQYAERTAINAPMQGTAADIIKKAMIAVEAWVEQHSDQMMMIMQVHDELVFEVEDSFLDEAKRQIRQHMEAAAVLNVPLVVDIGVGNNWDEAH